MSVRTLKAALAEMKKHASTTLEDNEDHKEKPIELHLNEGTKRVKHHPDPAHNGEAAWNEFTSGTPQLLGRAFDEFRSSSKKDKSFIAEHFSTKDYESHSPLLRKYAQAGLVPSGASLHERTRGFVPR